MKPVKMCSNLNALRNLCDMCEIKSKSIRNFGLTHGYFRHLLNSISLKLLPQDLVRYYYRKRDTSNESDVTDLISFLMSVK